MKTFISVKSSVTEEVQTMLNKQIVMEAKSSAYYLAAASWCHKEGYTNSSNYMYRHADEERMHMLKLFHYLNDAGGHSISPEVTNVRTNYNSLREIYEGALEHEVAVSLSIADLADFCFKMKDFATFQFLQWFIMEQREEEVNSRRCVELFHIIGEEGQGLWQIDQEIGKLDKAAHPAAAADKKAPNE
jgi:ferritin